MSSKKKSAKTAGKRTPRRKTLSELLVSASEYAASIAKKPDLVSQDVDCRLRHRNFYDVWLCDDDPGDVFIGSMLEFEQTTTPSQYYWHITPWGNHNKQWGDTKYETMAEAVAALKLAWEERKKQPGTPSQQQQQEVANVVSEILGVEEWTMPMEQMTIKDWMSLARTALWVANEGIFNAVRKMPYGGGDYLARKPIQAQVAGCVEVLDSLRHNGLIPDEPPLGVGVPPNPSLQKLARIILAQHGQRVISLGASAFSVS